MPEKLVDLICIFKDETSVEVNLGHCYIANHLTHVCSGAPALAHTSISDWQKLSSNEYFIAKSRSKIESDAMIAINNRKSAPIATGRIAHSLKTAVA